MGVNAGSGAVFGWFANMTAIAGLTTWFGICLTYIRFNKGYVAQGLDRSALPYASRLQPYAAWYGAIACVVICFVCEILFFSSSSKLHIGFTVQRLDRFPQGQMGYGYIHHELPAARGLPNLIHCWQNRISSATSQAS
jgi:hypothetical protein